MQLQRRTDYAIRVLLHLAVSDGAPQPIGSIAQAYGISEHHLAKVAQRLRELGYVTTVRGRNGGFVLATHPSDVCVGDLVRQLEPLNLVECFDRSANRCAITSPCALRGVLHEARDRFLEVLDDYTIADLISGHERALERVLKLRSG